MSARIDEKTRVGVYKDYRAGMKYSAIEIKYRISHRSVTMIIKEQAALHNESLRNPHEAMKSQEEMDARNAKIDELYRARYSIREIAEKVDCTKDVVNYYLRKKYGSSRRIKDAEPHQPIHGRLTPFITSNVEPKRCELTVEKVMQFRDNTKVGEIIQIRDYTLVVPKGTLRVKYKFRNMRCKVIQKSKFVVVTTAGTFPWKMCTI